MLISSSFNMLENNGVTFVGPSVHAIKMMGDKIESKKLAIDAGVSTVPGHMGVIKDDKEALTIAKEIGFPVMVKASAGGGGKGMRVVWKEEEMSEAFLSASNEARNSFSDDRIFIEKFIENPRHIEIQVIADKAGNTVCLGERECSIQRNNQKVIEEAPSPFMDEETRQKMYAQSKALAEKVGYYSAGTIEYIMDKNKNFYFLEMNTRLQVEHPVTELITGKDIVELMINIALGEKLPFEQKDITLNGWAMESRIYAEDPSRGFLPSSGRINLYIEPEESANVRVDSGVYEGGEVSMYYDPMIAKIIVHGPTRNIARARLVQALGQTRVAGTVTNLGFLGALARHGGFAKGEVDTGLIARDLVALTEAHGTPELRGAMLGVAALVGAGIVPGAATGFALWQPLEQSIGLSAEGAEVVVTFRLSEGGVQADLRFDGQSYDATWIDAAWQVAGQPRFEAVRAAGEVFVFAPGVTLECRIIDPLDRESDVGQGGDVALSPMPGLVRAVLVEAGQAVAAGERLAVLEAMKMEHALTAGRDGVVAEVLCAEGDQVEAGVVLVRLEPEGEA